MVKEVRFGFGCPVILSLSRDTPVTNVRETAIFERELVFWLKVLPSTLDDQTQVDSKPAGQPEHASLNQCQIIAYNRPELVLWAPPAVGGDKVFCVV